MLGFYQLVDEPGRGRKSYSPFLSAGRNTQAAQQLRFPRSTITYKNDRFRSFDVSALGQIVDLRCGHLRRLCEIEFLECLDSRQGSVGYSPLNRLPVSFLDLGGK